MASIEYHSTESSPGTVTGNWTNAALKVIDGSCAVETGSSGCYMSYYSSFASLDIPVGAIITGIKVETHSVRKYLGGSPTIEVYIKKNDSGDYLESELSATSQAAPSISHIGGGGCADCASKYWGGTTDKWTTTWKRTDNIFVRVEWCEDLVNKEWFLDGIEVIVYYIFPSWRWETDDEASEQVEYIENQNTQEIIDGTGYAVINLRKDDGFNEDVNNMLGKRLKLMREGYIRWRGIVDEVHVMNDYEVRLLLKDPTVLFQRNETKKNYLLALGGTKNVDDVGVISARDDSTITDDGAALTIAGAAGTYGVCIVPGSTPSHSFDTIDTVSFSGDPGDFGDHTDVNDPLWDNYAGQTGNFSAITTAHWTQMLGTFAGTRANVKGLKVSLTVHAQESPIYGHTLRLEIYNYTTSLWYGLDWLTHQPGFIGWHNPPDVLTGTISTNPTDYINAADNEFKIRLLCYGEGGIAVTVYRILHVGFDDNPGVKFYTDGIYDGTFYPIITPYHATVMTVTGTPQSDGIDVGDHYCIGKLNRTVLAELVAEYEVFKISSDVDTNMTGYTANPFSTRRTTTIDAIKSVLDRERGVRYFRANNNTVYFKREENLVDGSGTWDFGNTQVVRWIDVSNKRKETYRIYEVKGATYKVFDSEITLSETIEGSGGADNRTLVHSDDTLMSQAEVTVTAYSLKHMAEKRGLNYIFEYNDNYDDLYVGLLVYVTFDGVRSEKLPIRSISITWNGVNDVMQIIEVGWQGTSMEEEEANEITDIRDRVRRLEGSTYVRAGGSYSGPITSHTHYLVNLEDVSLAAPGADRITFWDHSDLQFEHLIAGSNLTIAANTIDVTMSIIAGATYDKLQDWSNTTQAAGKISGGVFSDINGDGSLRVAAGTGIIKTTDSCTGINVFFDWSEDTNVTLTDQKTNYVYIRYNAGSPDILATITHSDISYTDEICIGRVYRDGNDLHMLEAALDLTCVSRRLHNALKDVHGYIRASGLATSHAGVRNVAITEGKVYWGNKEISLNAFDSSGADTFDYYYRDGGGGWTVVAAQSQINNTNYDDGDGILGLLTGIRYGVHWVFMDYDSHVYVVYGRGNYKLAEAQTASLPSDLPDLITDFSILVARIIILKDAVVFTQIDKGWNGGISFATVNDHGALAGLADDDHIQYSLVDGSRDFTGHVKSPSSAPTLDYHLANKKYVDDQVATANELGELTDVTITAAATNDFLIYDTSQWVDKTVAQTKTILSLNLVENTALSSWIGSANITTVGTIGAGVWSGTALVAGKVPDHDSLNGFVAGEHFLQSAIVAVGTIAAGVWQGTAVANAFVADLPTSKITSGTFADARIAQSNITQHVAAIDHDALLNFVSGEHFTMLDEDDMVSNSATQAATQQSIKAYIDAIGTIDGAGTATYIPKWVDANTLTDSIISESGTTITIAGALSVTGALTDIIMWESATDPWISWRVGGTLAAPTQWWQMRVDNSESDVLEIRDVTNGRTMLSFHTDNTITAHSDFNSELNITTAAAITNTWESTGAATNVFFALKSKADCTFEIEADSDNVTESHQPTLGMYQDGRSRYLKIGIQETSNYKYLDVDTVDTSRMYLRIGGVDVAYYGTTGFCCDDLRAVTDSDHRIDLYGAADQIHIHAGDAAANRYLRITSAADSDDYPIVHPEGAEVNGSGGVGGASNRWKYGYIHTIYRSSEQAWDSHDDLALLESMAILKDDKGEAVTDELGNVLMDLTSYPDQLLSPYDKAEDKSNCFVNSGGMSSLLRGSIKQLHRKVKEQELLISELNARIVILEGKN